jgi:glycosyltransferase involved in cell wall biosynthesis
MPTVCIGIPTINRPQFVRETIGSVLGQTFPDFKVKVSDNCSSDDAIESVRRFIDSLADDRIEFHVQPTDVGEYGQGRYFMQQAQGHDYLMILHDDDVLESTYLEKSVAILESHTDVSLFMANPYLMNEAGEISRAKTKEYLHVRHRDNISDGKIDVLKGFFGFGITSVSGTLFRVDALRESGFVDANGLGNYPFECDLFLRLGDIDSTAWFASEELLGFRFHSSSMRNYMNIMENSHVVSGLTKLLSARQYSGNMERRRRVLLGRLHRAAALICLREGDYERSRSSIVQALQENILSPKAWLVAPFLFLVPSILRRILPELPESAAAPTYMEESKKN